MEQAKRNWKVWLWIAVAVAGIGLLTYCDVQKTWEHDAAVEEQRARYDRLLGDYTSVAEEDGPGAIDPDWKANKLDLGMELGNSSIMLMAFSIESEEDGYALLEAMIVGTDGGVYGQGSPLRFSIGDSIGGATGESEVRKAFKQEDLPIAVSISSFPGVKVGHTANYRIDGPAMCFERPFVLEVSTTDRRPKVNSARDLKYYNEWARGEGKSVIEHRNRIHDLLVGEFYREASTCMTIAPDASGEGGMITWHRPDGTALGQPERLVRFAFVADTPENRGQVARLLKEFALGEGDGSDWPAPISSRK